MGFTEATPEQTQGLQVQATIRADRERAINMLGMPHEYEIGPDKMHSLGVWRLLFDDGSKAVVRGVVLHIGETDVEADTWTVDGEDETAVDHVQAIIAPST